MKIIYQEADGNVCVITPAAKIVDDSVVPSDRTFRNAWSVDAATLTDGVGA